MLKRLPVIGIATAILVCATSASATTIPGQYIVVLKDGADTAAAVKKARSLGGTVTQQYRHALKGYAAQLSDAQAGKVKADPQVISVSTDGEMRLAATMPCSDLTVCQLPSFAIDRLDSESSSTRSGDGRGSVPVNVAVIDGGIQPDHPDLNVVGGKNCAPGENGYQDEDGHGTMVAGFIGARDNSIGRVGVAPGARLWAVRVGKAHGIIPDSWVICGLDFVAASRQDADPSNDIAIANMSLGGPNRDNTDCNSTKLALRIAVCNVVRAGVVVVTSAGNESEDIAIKQPAAWEEVLTVTAMGDRDGQPGGLGGEFECLLGEFDDTAASFSDFATLADDKAHTVAAPGVCIGSTFINSQYAVGSGTSAASPLASGTVALCLASGKKPCAGLTPAQIIQKIVGDATAYNSANPGYGFTGDPLRPITGKYYGYLIRAGLY